MVMNFAKLITQINEGNLPVEVLTAQEWSDLETAIKSFNQRPAAIQVEPYFLKIINVLQEILNVYISDLECVYVVCCCFVFSIFLSTCCNYDYVFNNFNTL